MRVPPLKHYTTSVLSITSQLGVMIDKIATWPVWVFGECYCTDMTSTLDVTCTVAWQAKLTTDVVTYAWFLFNGSASYKGILRTVNSDNTLPPSWYTSSSSMFSLSCGLKPMQSDDFEALQQAHRTALYNSTCCSTGQPPLPLVSCPCSLRTCKPFFLTTPVAPAAGHASFYMNLCHHREQKRKLKKFAVRI